MKTRTAIAMAAIFGAEAKKAVTGRRRALVDVRRPHVERHGRDLEGDAGRQEHEAEDRRRSAPAPCSAAAMPGNETVPVKP